MKVLVCGGRRYDDRTKVYETLDVVCPTVIIEGGATGADSLAGAFAKDRGIKLKVYPANWKRHGKIAGFLRNQEMIDKEHPDLVVAFPGGNGTADMVYRARLAGIKVMEIQ